MEIAGSTAILAPLVFAYSDVALFVLFFFTSSLNLRLFAMGSLLFSRSSSVFLVSVRT